MKHGRFIVNGDRKQKPRTNVLDLIAEVASTIVYGHKTWFTWRAERILVHLLTHSNDFTRELQLIITRHENWFYLKSWHIDFNEFLIFLKENTFDKQPLHSIKLDRFSHNKMIQFFPKKRMKINEKNLHPKIPHFWMSRAIKCFGTYDSVHSIYNSVGWSK